MHPLLGLALAALLAQLSSQADGPFVAPEAGPTATLCSPLWGALAPPLRGRSGACAPCELFAALLSALLGEALPCGGP